MRDYAAMVDMLCAHFDSQTRNALGYRRCRVHVVGSNESYYVKALCKKLSSLGIEVVQHYPQLRTWVLGHREPVIYDTDDKSIRTTFLRGLQDVDAINNAEGTSSCAYAIYRLLNEAGLIAGKNITIIGRGHAVQNLHNLLIRGDATVTVCHSKTQEVTAHCDLADVVIVAAPNIGVPIYADELILDISGAAKHYARPKYGTGACDYFDKIGKLTLSILAMWCARDAE